MRFLVLLEAAIVAMVAVVALGGGLFHVFWSQRHADLRPNEMTRYSYPVKDRRNLGLMAPSSGGPGHGWPAILLEA